jgi:hypothetical protein
MVPETSKLTTDNVSEFGLYLNPPESVLSFSSISLPEAVPPTNVGK